jgi:glutamate carboxypeptidase
MPDPIFVAQVMKELQRREGEILALLDRLVRVDSGSYHKAGIDQMGDVLAGELRSLGFEAQVLSEPDRGNHLLARRRSPGRPRVFLSCHLDTVTRPEHFPAGPRLRLPPCWPSPSPASRR